MCMRNAELSGNANLNTEVDGPLSHNHIITDIITGRLYITEISL